jgi:hypothetical protein
VRPSSGSCRTGARSCRRQVASDQVGGAENQEASQRVGLECDASGPRDTSCVAERNGFELSVPVPKLADDSF